MPEDLTTYPQRQQYYRINLTALSWRELRAATGGPVGFVLTLPFLGFMKVFRIPMTATVMPKEITFRPLSFALAPAVASRLQRLVEEMQALGFRPFSTFEIPEMPYRVAIFALAREDGTAYADVGYFPVRDRHYFELVSYFADGSSLTTVNRQEAVSLQSPPGRFNQYVATQSPAVAFDRHQEQALAMVAEHGPLRPGLTEATYFADFRAYMRRFVQFQAERGVATPTLPPISPPGAWQR
jgi:hypothetical protein